MTGTYTPITKTLKKATANVRTSDNVVLEWNIEVIYEFAGDSDLVAWKNTYSHSEDVAYLGKTQEQFTKSELIAMMPANIEGHIFHAHYEAFNFPPTEERVNVDLSTLAD